LRCVLNSSHSSPSSSPSLRYQKASKVTEERIEARNKHAGRESRGVKDAKTAKLKQAVADQMDSMNQSESDYQDACNALREGQLHDREKTNKLLSLIQDSEAERTLRLKQLFTILGEVESAVFCEEDLFFKDTQSAVENIVVTGQVMATAAFFEGARRRTEAKSHADTQYENLSEWVPFRSLKIEGERKAMGKSPASHGARATSLESPMNKARAAALKGHTRRVSQSMRLPSPAAIGGDMFGAGGPVPDFFAEREAKKQRSIMEEESQDMPNPLAARLSPKTPALPTHPLASRGRRAGRVSVAESSSLVSLPADLADATRGVCLFDFTAGKFDELTVAEGDEIVR
jgi:hypothetical protein